jgi:hypothetical protein
MSEASISKAVNSGDEWLKSYLAACVSFFVGGKTDVDFRGNSVIVYSAGYYQNIGA